jgi:hypothetical protein
MSIETVRNKLKLTSQLGVIQDMPNNSPLMLLQLVNLFGKE